LYYKELEISLVKATPMLILCITTSQQFICPDPEAAVNKARRGSAINGKDWAKFIPKKAPFFSKMRIAEGGAA
jgi:hypothetical protein